MPEVFVRSSQQRFLPMPSLARQLFCSSYKNSSSPFSENVSFAVTWLGYQEEVCYGKIRWAA